MRWWILVESQEFKRLCCCNEASITNPNNENTNESKDEYQPYLINDYLYEMVLNCPSAYNDTFNIFSKD